MDDAADQAFVIDYDDLMREDEPVELTLLHLVDGRQTETIPWQADHRPMRWRGALMDARRAQRRSVV